MSKRKRHQRLERIPSGGARLVQTMVPAAGGLTVARQLNEQAAVFSDGSIRFNLQKFGSPQDQYDADFAWIQFALGWVRIYFGQMGDAARLHSRVEVKYSPEAFFGHFWMNSRAFHEGLRVNRRESAVPRDPERDRLEPERLPPDKRHTLTANFDIIARAGSEASIDFFHIPPSAVATWNRTGDGAGMKAAAKLRVLLSADELLRLLDQSEPIAKLLGPALEHLVGERTEREQ